MAIVAEVSPLIPVYQRYVSAVPVALTLSDAAVPAGVVTTAGGCCVIAGDLQRTTLAA